MLTQKDLEETLKQLPFTQVVVRVEGRPRHWVAEVSSPDFSGQDEFERQQKVWEYLIVALTDEQRAEVEFVFTLEPEEVIAAEACIPT